MGCGLNFYIGKKIDNSQNSVLKIFLYRIYFNTLLRYFVYDSKKPIFSWLSIVAQVSNVTHIFNVRA